MKVYYYLLYYKANQIRGECIRSCRQSPVCASRAPGATSRGGRAAGGAASAPCAGVGYRAAAAMYGATDGPLSGFIYLIRSVFYNHL